MEKESKIPQKEQKIKKPAYSVCEKCGESSNVIPGAYGKPGPELLKKSKEGKVKLLGCCLPGKAEERKRFYCKKCDFLF